MNKLEFMRLWDAYSALLTPVQQEMTDMYFNMDLTMSEISKLKNISRQAVSNCMKSCKQQLEEYESKLGFVAQTTRYSLEVSFMMTDIDRALDDMCARHPELSAEAEKIRAYLEKDYSAEARAAAEEN